MLSTFLGLDAQLLHSPAYSLGCGLEHLPHRNGIWVILADDALEILALYIIGHPLELFPAHRLIELVGVHFTIHLVPFLS